MAARVFRCRDLIREVAQYQAGLHISLIHLPPRCFGDHDAPDETEWGHHYAIAVATDTVVSAWFADYGKHGLSQLLEAHPGVAHGVFYWAVASCGLDVLWSLEATYGHLAPRGLLDVAAARGNLSLVTWLHTHKSTGCSSNAMDMAADGGHLRVVEFLHRHRTEGATVAGFEAAVQQGHIAIVRFLYDAYPRLCRPNVYEVAAAYGQLDVLRYLCRYTAPFAVSIQRAKQTAAQTGQFAILAELQMLYPVREHLVPIARGALRRQHTALVHFFTTELWPTSGSLEAFIGRPAVQAAIIEAARCNNLALLTLLDAHEPRVPWPTDALTAAAAVHTDVVRFIAARHPEATSAAALDAAVASSRAPLELIIVLLHTLHLPADPRLAVLHGRLDVLEYYAAHPAIVPENSWNAELANLAAAHGRLEIIAFLHAHLPEGWSVAAMNAAASFGHVEVVSFLHEHRTEGCSDEGLERALARRHKATVAFLCRACPHAFSPKVLASATDFLRIPSRYDRKCSLADVVC
ncbi:hypothetical protein ACHHYP_15983 [Achlya hypogyna]|uniref:Uncharacterized protein n=1 Tax=Achlya hypogyna TaxID=1202772 RepID=A0A1V9Y9R0_ACHHY|nr:hypothetical protein ACHHYP_15983 [Achlya hypogyna]